MSRDPTKGKPRSDDLSKGFKRRLRVRGSRVAEAIKVLTAIEPIKAVAHRVAEGVESLREHRPRPRRHKRTWAVGHTEGNSGPPEGHQWAIRGPPEGHQWAIGGPSQRTTKRLS